MHCRFELFPDGSSYSVKLRLEDGRESVAPFGFDLSEDSRIGQVIARIDAGNCQLDNLRDVGSELWSALCSGDLMPLFQSAREAAGDGVLGVALDIPIVRSLDAVPWEAMYDETAGRFLCCDPDLALYRAPARDTPRAASPRADAQELRLLTIVPERSGLQVPYEWDTLDNLAPFGVRMEPLDGRVTVKRLSSTLRDQQFDIVHYIGHGDFDESDGVTVRMNDDTADKQTWIEASQFATMFVDQRIQLAVINCCLSSPSQSRRLAGLGPQLTRTARVPAVVAMRYEIDDSVAIQFAETFYRQLFSGKHPGRVDVAMQAARLTLMRVARKDTVRGFITPILYLAEGREQLFTARAQRPNEITSTTSITVVHEGPAVKLPPKLVSAVRGGRCIPVIGSEIHSYAQVRREAAAPTLRQIVTELAKAWDYPEQDELKFADRAGEGFVTLILPRVFQHFERTKERAQIVAAIKKMYVDRRGSPLLERIAAWNVPGVIYTHIDTLMHAALNRPDVRVLNSVEVDQKEAQALTSAIGRQVAVGQDREPFLLFNVRGSWNDPSSLILTEKDHEDLEERLSLKGGEIATLLKGDKQCRTLLFIGVHPRDPVIRRLCKTHLPDVRRVGRYFVTPKLSEVDKDYWEELHIDEWLVADPAAIVDALTDAISRGDD